MNNRSREGFYALWTIAILLCLAACIFVLAYVSIVSGPTTAQSPAAPEGDPTVQGDGQFGASLTGDGDFMAEPTDAPTATPEPTPPPVVLEPTDDMGEDYLNRIVFLGDSTTYGLASYGVLPFTQVWVPESGTLSLFNWEIETINYYPPDDPDNPRPLSIVDCASTRRPEYLVITLGINGIALLNESQFKDYYRRLVMAIQEASPDTKIICQSIYPVVDSLAATGINNAGVTAANGWIRDVAEETGTRFLNTHDSLLDPATGQLVAEYAPWDGIHMIPDALNLILQYVRTHGYQ